MKRYSLLAGWPKLVVVTGLVTWICAADVATAFAASSSFCRAYARDPKRTSGVIGV